MRRRRKLAMEGKTTSGKARWGSKSAPSLPSATRNRRPQTTPAASKSTKLPPTFRGYSKNLKADLIYAKFHVDSVVAARERRHIDRARRERIFKVQALRKRNKAKADSKRAEERKQHQTQLLEEANANVEKEKHADDALDEVSATVVTDADPESSIDTLNQTESIQSSAMERMPSSPHLNIDLIRPNHNHSFTISPKRAVFSAARTRQVATLGEITSSVPSPKVLKLEKKLNFVGEDDNLSFKRRGLGTSNLLEGKDLNPVVETRPTRNKALLYLRDYKDDLTTLNSRTPIDFNRMAKQERYPSWIVEKEATAEKMSKRSFHAYLETYRKRMEKRVEAQTIQVSKDDRRRILAFAGKEDAKEKKPKNVGAQTLYYERKKAKVLTPHEEKMQLKHIERLKVEQDQRVKANALLAESKRRRRRRKGQLPQEKEHKSKKGTKGKSSRDHASGLNAEDIVSYKVMERKHELSRSLERPSSVMHFATSPSITSSFQKPYFENLKMSSVKQRQLEDMLVRMHQIKKYNKAHPGNMNASLDEKKMFQALNRASTMQVISVKNDYANKYRRRRLDRPRPKQSSKLFKTPLHRLPIADSKETYQSVFDTFNNEGEVLWGDLELLHRQVSPVKNGDRSAAESPFPRAKNPFAFNPT